MPQVLQQGIVPGFPIAQFDPTGEAGHSVCRAEVIKTCFGQLHRRQKGQGPGLEGLQPGLLSSHCIVVGAHPDWVEIWSGAHRVGWKVCIGATEIATVFQTWEQQRGGSWHQLNTGSWNKSWMQVLDKAAARVQLLVLFNRVVSLLPVIQHQATTEAFDLVDHTSVIKPSSGQTPLWDRNSGREGGVCGHSVQFAGKVIFQLKCVSALHQLG